MNDWEKSMPPSRDAERTAQSEDSILSPLPPSDANPATSASSVQPESETAVNRLPEAAAPEEQTIPMPASAALDAPHLSAEELEQEAGDSEPWDEDSHESGDKDSDDDPDSDDR